MSTKPDNPPAFPNPEMGKAHFDQPGVYPGMTLRDYFAGQALAGMSVGLVGELKTAGRSEISAYAHGPCNAILAERAYAAADAMLTARQKETP